MAQASACMPKLEIPRVCISTSSQSAPALHKQDSCEEDDGCLAPLPIELQYFSVDLRVDDNVIAALEHPNRVHSIFLGGISIPLERLVAVMQEPFPAMEALTLQVEGPGRTVPALPKTFLRGSAPHLRSLTLDGIPFPALPQLLLSSDYLVDLTLDRIPQNGYISPETMAGSLSALTRLVNLSIKFISPTSRPHPTNRRPPPLSRAVLPALTNFNFCGVSEYLEDLMAQIDAPLLRAARITFFNQLVFDIRQLPRLIGHAPTLMTYDTAEIHFYTDCIVVVFSSMTFNDFLTFQISCRDVDWQVSSMAQLCNQLSGSFIISSIETLYIQEIQGMTLEDVMDGTPWLELFHPFTAVRTLYISHTMQSHVVSALRGLSGELAMQVLPALETLRVPGYQGSGSERHDMWPFIIARQRSNHPVVVQTKGMSS
ncbi:hypothetical protein BGW80DRAFT_181640 [Lactifluus volemus]|nr:hypothetical protein BGW80DRAFT_181640 [Lactifluus volemus]